MTTVFTCLPDLTSILSLVYDAWDSHLGYRNIRLMLEPYGNLELFCEYRHVEPDEKKAASVIRSIQKKISMEAYELVYCCAMSCRPDSPDIIYRFLLYGFSYGAKTMHMLQESAVFEAFALSRHVMNEAHHFREFIRFSRVPGDILVSHIEPDADLLTLLAPSFADRLPSENWMIVDDRRKKAVVQPSDDSFYLTSLTEKEIRQIREKESRPDLYQDLWNIYFASTAIRERKNPRCQQTLLPLKYRKHMTEF